MMVITVSIPKLGQKSFIGVRKRRSLQTLRKLISQDNISGTTFNFNKQNSCTLLLLKNIWTIKLVQNKITTLQKFETLQKALTAFLNLAHEEGEHWSESNYNKFTQNCFAK